jgi:hypothetical protein
MKDFVVSGPMRVPKEQIANLPSLDAVMGPPVSSVQALRVPMSQAVSVESGELATDSRPPSATPSLEGHSSTTAPSAVTQTAMVPPPSAVKKRITVAEFVKSPKSEKWVDPALLLSRLKSSSSDWSHRSQVFDQLIKQIQSSGNKDFKLSHKMVEMIGLGLDDGHFRVQNAALNALKELVKKGEVVESLYTKCILVAFQKGVKLSNGPKGEGEERDMVEEYTDKLGEMAVSLLVHGLGDPGLHRKGKAKMGLLYVLAQFVKQERVESFAQKGSNLKFLVARLASVAAENLDKMGQENVMSLVKTVVKACPDTFWTVWSGLKVSEQSSLSKVFGVPDLLKRKSLVFGDLTVTAPTLTSEEQLQSPSRSRIPVMRHSPHPSPVVPSIVHGMDSGAPLSPQQLKKQDTVETLVAEDERADMAPEDKPHFMSDEVKEETVKKDLKETPSQSEESLVEETRQEEIKSAKDQDILMVEHFVQDLLDSVVLEAESSSCVSPKGPMECRDLSDGLLKEEEDIVLAQMEPLMAVDDIKDNDKVLEDRDELTPTGEEKADESERESLLLEENCVEEREESQELEQWHLEVSPKAVPDILSCLSMVSFFLKIGEINLGLIASDGRALRRMKM